MQINSKLMHFKSVFGTSQIKLVQWKAHCLIKNQSSEVPLNLSILLNTCSNDLNKCRVRHVFLWWKLFYCIDMSFSPLQSFVSLSHVFWFNSFVFFFFGYLNSNHLGIYWLLSILTFLSHLIPFNLFHQSSLLSCSFASTWGTCLGYLIAHWIRGGEMPVFG